MELLSVEVTQHSVTDDGDLRFNLGTATPDNVRYKNGYISINNLDVEIAILSDFMYADINSVKGVAKRVINDMFTISKITTISPTQFPFLEDGVKKAVTTVNDVIKRLTEDKEERDRLKRIKLDTARRFMNSFTPIKAPTTSIADFIHSVKPGQHIKLLEGPYVLEDGGELFINVIKGYSINKFDLIYELEQEELDGDDYAYEQRILTIAEVKELIK